MSTVYGYRKGVALIDMDVDGDFTRYNISWVTDSVGQLSWPLSLHGYLDYARLQHLDGAVTGTYTTELFDAFGEDKLEGALSGSATNANREVPLLCDVNGDGSVLLPRLVSGDHYLQVIASGAAQTHGRLELTLRRPRALYQQTALERGGPAPRAALAVKECCPKKGTGCLTIDVVDNAFLLYFSWTADSNGEVQYWLNLNRQVALERVFTRPGSVVPTSYDLRLYNRGDLDLANDLLLARSTSAPEDEWLQKSLVYLNQVVQSPDFRRGEKEMPLTIAITSAGAGGSGALVLQGRGLE